MKKIIPILSLISLFIFTASNTFAAATPTPTPADLQDQVNELQERIASRVAQLNLVEKKGILGTVTDVSDTQITLQNLQNKTRIIDADELTKFSSSSSDSFGISDIKKGMFLGVLGLYNKDTQHTQARVIYEQSPLPNFIYGAVYSIDEENFTFEVAKENGARNSVDVEKVTKTYALEDGDFVKSGFSKIKIGETLIAVGFNDKQNKNQILGSRILLFPQISTSPKISLSQTEPPITPSTGSGVKLQPIVK